MEFVLIGKIINTFGIKGELKIESYSDFIDERFQKDSTVYVGETYIPFKVKQYHIHKGFVIVQFIDNEDINLVEKYKNQKIYKAKSDIKPLNKGEYFFSDLKDLDVYVEDKKVGKVLRVEEGATHNNLRVLKDSKEYLVPFIPAFILNVDLDSKRIDINNIEGLF